MRCSSRTHLEIHRLLEGGSLFPMQTKKSRLVQLLGLLLLMVLLLTLVVPTALADDIHQTQGFRNEVTLAGIREHQAAFQAIAGANGGTRSSGTPGYDA